MRWFKSPPKPFSWERPKYRGEMVLAYYRRKFCGSSEETDATNIRDIIIDLLTTIPDEDWTILIDEAVRLAHEESVQEPA